LIFLIQINNNKIIEKGNLEISLGPDISIMRAFKVYWDKEENLLEVKEFSRPWGLFANRLKENNNS
jgi:hypothetical protein